jgi:hypothetical protein
MAEHKRKKMPLVGMPGSYFEWVNSKKETAAQETKVQQALTAVSLSGASAAPKFKFNTIQELRTHVTETERASKEYHEKAFKELQARIDEEEGSVFMVAQAKPVKDDLARRIAQKKNPALVILDSAADRHLVNADAGPGLGNMAMASQELRTAKLGAKLHVDGSAIFRGRWGGNKLVFKCKVAKELTHSVLSLPQLLDEGFDMRTAKNGNKIELFFKKNPKKVKLAFFRHNGLFVSILEMAVKGKPHRKTEDNVTFLSQSQCNGKTSSQQQQQQPAEIKSQLVAKGAAKEPGKTQEVGVGIVRRRAQASHSRRSWRRKTNSVAADNETITSAAAKLTIADGGTAAIGVAE